MKRNSLSRMSTLLIIAILLAGGAFISTTQSAKASASLSTIYGLHVSGNQLLNGNGENVRLLGVNRSGTEYKCVNNAGIFDGPSDAASVDAMASWHINVVRVPLNEDCWLGINGVQDPYTGANYQQAIEDYVSLLNSRNLMVILDLHWNAAGSDLSFYQKAMADGDHAYDFWTSVSNTFKNNSSVIFDLYNEPYPSNGDCWKNGSTSPSTAPCADVPFAAAGMQGMIYTVRNTGATNVILLSGWGYANYIGGVLDPSYLPSDPQNNEMVSTHVYANSGCNTTDCYTSQYAAVAATLPVVMGELGENDCQHSFIDTAMNWADQNNIGYLGWAWDVADCSAFPALISSYDGTPTAFGVGFRDHLLSIN